MMSLKNDEEIKEELIIHLAKAILSGITNARDSIKQVVVVLCSVAIPAYLSLLKLFETSLSNITILIKMLPILIWLTMLSLAVILIKPRFDFIDFKSPQRIIERYLRSIRKQVALSFIFVLGTCIGIILACCIILQV